MLQLAIPRLNDVCVVIDKSGYFICNVHLTSLILVNLTNHKLVENFCSEVTRNFSNITVKRRKEVVPVKRIYYELCCWYLFQFLLECRRCGIMLHHPGNFLLQIPFPPSAVCFEICMYAELCLHLSYRYKRWCLHCGNVWLALPRKAMHS